MVKRADWHSGGRALIGLVFCAACAGSTPDDAKDGDRNSDGLGAGASALPPASGNASSQPGSSTNGAGQGGGSTGEPATPAGGSNASAGSGGDAPARPRMPRTDLDPNVRFDWDESAPNSALACQPGKYVGNFECKYIPDAMNPDLFAIVVKGPVELHLQRSADGEFLEISDGTLFGIAEDVFGFTAKLSGRLDCATLELQAQALDGVYGFGDPAVFPIGTFAGTLGGTLDGVLGALAGDWKLGVDGGGSCDGPWKASFTP